MNYDLKFYMNKPVQIQNSRRLRISVVILLRLLIIDHRRRIIHRIVLHTSHDFWPASTYGTSDKSDNIQEYEERKNPHW
jgi:hypothetical protein